MIICDLETTVPETSIPKLAYQHFKTKNEIHLGLHFSCHFSQFMKNEPIFTNLKPIV